MIRIRFLIMGSRYFSLIINLRWELTHDNEVLRSAVENQRGSYLPSVVMRQTIIML